MRNRPEAVLFLAVLMIVGFLTWWKLDEEYRPAPVPSPRWAETAEVALLATIRLTSPVLETPGDRRRSGSLFAPPRELLPLDPLVLPEPPAPALSVRRPSVQPSLAGVHARAYRMGAEELGSLVLGAQTVEPVFDGAGETLPDTESSVADVLDPTELERRFDWVVRVDRTRRLYGKLLNDDPHGLWDRPAEDLRFQQFSERSGRPLGAPFVILRAEVIDLGLALTFANDYVFRSRALGSGPGSVASRRSLAMEMAAAWPAQARGLEFAEAEALGALKAGPRDPVTARLLAGVRRLRVDLNGELAVYRLAREGGWADAPLLADQALVARRLGMPERAQELLAQASALARASAPVLFARGLLLGDEGQHAEALAALRKADGLAFPGPLAERARQRLKVALGEALLATGQVKEALREAERLVLDDPEHLEGLLLLGAARAAAGDLDQASDAFGRAVAAAPDHGRALTNAGIVAWRRGDGDGASRLLQRAQDADPYRAVAPTLALGFLYEDAGERETARDRYAAALELEPGHPGALYRLGRNQRLDGDPEAAGETLREALRLAGPETLLLLELGSAAMDRGRHDEAQRYFREALRLEADDAEVLWHLGLATLHSGDLHAAGVPLAAAAAAGLGGAHVGLGVVAYRLGDVDDALHHFDEVAKAFAGRADRPQAVYAAVQAARIRDHRTRRQWLDRFARSSLQRGWTEHLWDGSPHVHLASGRVHVEGRMENPREDERPGISRPVEGATFHAAQAELTPRAASQTRCGLMLTYRSVRGAQGRRPKARLDIWVDVDGTVRASALDNFDRVVRGGEPLNGVVVEPGEAVLLGVERLDATRGRFTFTIGGRPVGAPLELKSLRRFKNPFELQVYAEAAPGRSAAADISLVRVVQKL